MTSQIEHEASNLQGGQRNASRNDGHLPECFMAARLGVDTYAPDVLAQMKRAGCICDRLRACQQRERDLWERVATERIRDLMSCHKPDDCHARADSIEVLLDDVAYYREGKP